MGGGITVRSKVGKGTTFSFNIKSKISLVARKQCSYLNTKSNENKKVLVIDDNPNFLAILKSQIEQWKLVPVVALSGKEALQIFSTEKDFSLVITDMLMPEMDGIELARRMKELNKSVPIVLLSAVGDENRSKYPELFTSVLTKPVKESQLFNVLQLEQKTNKDTTVAETEKKAPAALSEDFAKENPLTILLAEDNLINQKLAVRVLNKLGYEVDIANNGVEAVGMLQNKDYDVVLMDILMPEMDGLEATRVIRSGLQYQPQIIAMTANAMPEDRENCLKAGMDNYISKPIKIEELLSLLKEASMVAKDR
jgi:CheY-like chemotaxis protein